MVVYLPQHGTNDKMRKHAKNYLNYFNLGEQDFIYCEYSFVELGVMIRADDLHHIIYRSHGGSDEFENIIALSRNIHNKAHDNEISKQKLTEVHNHFVEVAPY